MERRRRRKGVVGSKCSAGMFSGVRKSPQTEFPRADRLFVWLLRKEIRTQLQTRGVPPKMKIKEEKEEKEEKLTKDRGS